MNRRKFEKKACVSSDHSQKNNNKPVCNKTVSSLTDDQGIESFLINSSKNTKSTFIHTPNPHPGRGVYGFALYLFSWILFIVYLLWAFLPDRLLKSLQLIYLPAKYWAIVVPLLIPVLIETAMLKLVLNKNNNVRNYSSAAKEILRRYDRVQKAKLLENQNGSGAFKKQDVKDIKNVDDLVLGDVESFAASKLLKSKLSQFDSFARKREKELTKIKDKKLVASKNQSNTFSRPLSADQNLNVFKNALPDLNLKKKEKLKLVVDRGFFVRSEGGFDEYTNATADELPENEMTELPFEVFGYVNNQSVETIPINNPGQVLTSMNSSKKMRKIKKAIEEDNDIGEWLSNYGTECDDTIPPLADAKCYGCGANFHCNNSSLPGFVPVELFQDIKNNLREEPIYQRTDDLCRRCFLFKEYNFLLNVNVCNVDYRAIMGHLKLIQEALILLVVDMADLQNSIHQTLPEIIGRGKPMIVIGNKIDLLPPDGEPGYLKRYYDALKSAMADSGFAENFNILKYSLISAKTGYGVEDLITNVYMKWQDPRGVLRSNIYLVGSTNAGKSTLFNTLLQSDLCKVRAMDLVERVTTSIWPGTTLSLLKFPIWNPTPYKLELRRQRLIENQKWKWKEKYIAENLYKSTNDTQYITLQSFVGSTFKAAEDEGLPVNMEEKTKQFFGDSDALKPTEGEMSKFKASLNLNDSCFQLGHWCFDTPGTVNMEQVLDLFTLDELINVIPRSLILPRTFIVYGGESLLIGGVGRVDVLSAKRYNGAETPIFLTVFASNGLPLNHMKTYQVDQFLYEFAGTKILGAPLGDKIRLESFPELRCKKFNVKNSANNRSQESCSDILLSSLGWVSITGNLAESVQLKAWTPEARGIQVRTPALLKKPVLLSGNRIPGTNAYETKLPAKIEESIYSRGQKSNVKGSQTSISSFSPIDSGKSLPTTSCFDLA